MKNKYFLMLVIVFVISTVKAKDNKRNPIIGKWIPAHNLVNGAIDPGANNDRVQEYREDQTYDARINLPNGEEQILYRGKYFIGNDSTIIAVRCNENGALNNLSSVYNVKVQNDTLHLYGYAIKTLDGKRISSFYLDEYWVRKKH